MKGVLAAFLLVLMAGCQSPGVTLSASDQAALLASSKTWVATYNQNDWTALAALFTQDALLMPPNSPAVQGRKAIAAWQAQNESGFRIALDIQNIDGNGTLAYLTGRSCLYIPMGDGYGVELGKFLEVRNKQPNGEWLIATEIFNADGPPDSDLLAACPFSPLTHTLP